MLSAFDQAMGVARWQFQPITSRRNMIRYYLSQPKKSILKLYLFFISHIERILIMRKLFIMLAVMHDRTQTLSSIKSRVRVFENNRVYLDDLVSRIRVEQIMT